MEIFPNWTTIPIVFFLILLTFILNRTFFRPLGKKLEDREKLIGGARVEAEQIRRASQERVLEFDRKLREARREADQQLAQVKNAALGEKAGIVSAQRKDTEKMLSDARAEIKTKTDEARRTLELQAQLFAFQIASRILKRPVQRKRPV